MAEWPKKMVIYPPPESRHLAKDVEVIPADLGRELYEALKKAHAMVDERAAVRAIARYEREVGR